MATLRVACGASSGDVAANAAVVSERSMHYRKTRRGNVVKIVEERYLRTDLGLGARHGKTLAAADMALPSPPPGPPSTVAAAGTGAQPASLAAAVAVQPLAWLVPDTNVVLHQLDLLEYEGSAHLDHIIILETVAEEVRHNNLAAHKRLVRLLKSERRQVIFFANEHSKHCYVRRSAGETPNDRNDRAIRVAAQWLGDQLFAAGAGAGAGAQLKAGKGAAARSEAPLLLLSDDRLNREAVKAMPAAPGGCALRAMTARGMVRSLGVPALADLVAAFDDEDGETADGQDGGGDAAGTKGTSAGAGAGAGAAGAKGSSASSGLALRGDKGKGGEAALFPAHLTAKEAAEGVLAGRLFQGVLRCSRGVWDDCYVVVKGQASGDGAEERVSVLLTGTLHVNRAVEGDVVAVEILPRDEWEAPAQAEARVQSKAGGQGRKGGAAGAFGASGSGQEEADACFGAGVAEPTAPPSVGDMENVAPVALARPSTAGGAAAKGGKGGKGGAATGAAVLPSPRGRVVAIVKRNWKHYCGSLASDLDDKAVAQAGSGSKQGGAVSCLVVPVDKRIPRIRIVTRQRESLSGKRLVVAIDDWPATSRYPRGHYVSTLGAAGDKAVETAVLLLEHDIPTGDFSGEVLGCLPPEGWEVDDAAVAAECRFTSGGSSDAAAMTDDAKDVSQRSGKRDAHVRPARRDLRHLPVMSIDPPGCRDIDDALHWRDLGNGLWEVGIHIADVTHFMAAGTALDEEAANRSTSTYLVDRRLDMLPKMLTEKLCSLVGNKDRFAFSVLLTMTPEAEIVGADFCKSVIHSIGAHTYGQAQDMLDDPSDLSVKAESVRKLNGLARIFRRRRMEAGALTLASPEVKFVLDQQTQNPLDVTMYALKETNALVEEFMLLANITVGKKVLRHFPTLSLLRRHPAPAKSQFGPLVSAAKAAGFDIGTADSKALAASLDAAEKADDPYFNKLLRIVCTRCMAPAQYFSSGEQLEDEWRHYGLATPVYTHFTSPIRRYADVVVHRLLSAAIGVEPLPPALCLKTGLHDLAENMNRRHRAAQLAGRASVSLHTQLYFRDHPAVGEKAYVLGCHPDKVVVLVPRFGIEGTIWLGDEAARGLVDFDAESHTVKLLSSAVGGQVVGSVQVFQAVKVHISVSARGKGADGTGRPVVRVLLTDPPIGEQPEAAAGAAGAEDGHVAAESGKRKNDAGGPADVKKSKK